MKLASIVLAAASMVVMTAIPQQALAEDITVESATPDIAEQNTIDLDVVILGNGFDRSAEVQFCSTDPCDPLDDNITVISSKVRGSTRITATINIKQDATLLESGYDIEVRLSNGRRGKGTTLFKVVEEGSLTPGGGPSDRPGDLEGCMSILNTGSGEDMYPDISEPYCDEVGGVVLITADEGRLRINTDDTRKFNPTSRDVIVDAKGCTHPACDPVMVIGMTTEREHQVTEGVFQQLGTVSLPDMTPGEVTRVEGQIRIDKTTQFKYSTPNSDRIKCPTNSSSPLWLSCDGKVGSNPDTTCNLWTLTTFDINDGSAGNGSGNARPCLVEERRAKITVIEDAVELDFTLSLCLTGESCTP